MKMQVSNIAWWKQFKNLACSLEACYYKTFFFFLLSYVEERPWWPTQSPNKGTKKEAKG